jgi:DNA-binding SARP family transcriptional activator
VNPLTAAHGSEAVVVAPLRLQPPTWSLHTVGQDESPEARLQIRCFGPFEVVREGKPVVRWRRRAAERMLKFLLVTGHRVHRDVLLDVLWPEVAFESSISGFRVTVHALRHALASERDAREGMRLIQADGDTYGLNMDGVWIDASQFSHHYYQALRLEREQHVEAAMREFAAAEALYRDDFLVDDLYEDWTVLRREELKDQYLQVLTKLSQFCLMTGDLDGCISRSHALLAKEPCREDAYQQLMHCYVALGHRGRALRWYEICERTLRKELDIGPSSETRVLYQRITTTAT